MESGKAQEAAAYALEQLSQGEHAVCQANRDEVIKLSGAKKLVALLNVLNPQTQVTLTLTLTLTLTSHPNPLTQPQP